MSLFLSEGIQLQSGKLVMPSCINDQVGVVRTFDADGKQAGEEKLQVASQKVSFVAQAGCAVKDGNVVVEHHAVALACAVLVPVW